MRHFNRDFWSGHLSRTGHQIAARYLLDNRIIGVRRKREREREREGEPRNGTRSISG